MRRRLLWLGALGGLVAAGSARADGFVLDCDDVNRHLESGTRFLANLRQSRQQAVPPGAPPRPPPPPDGTEYLDGIGSDGRCWELSSDTAFGERQVLTQRVELARAVRWDPSTLSLVHRVRLGAAAAFLTGASSFQGLNASLGVRHQPAGGKFAVEVGLRVVPGWGGPAEPQLQTLALDATFTSALGSDSFWLPLGHTGVQAYFDVQTRTAPWSRLPLLVGARYGGEVSLAPMLVRTWLGPQQAFVANAYLEVFLGAPKLGRSQLGVHADLSLSSIWPGNVPLPLVANGFLGWSPCTWFSMRGFLGAGINLDAGPSYQLQGGVRFALYAP